MTTLIDRITKRIDELKKSTCTKSIVDELERVKAELTAVKGVDELEAQLNQAQNNAEIWTAIWAIYDYLKQTPVAEEYPCTECGGNAYEGYIVEEGNCKIAKGERLCKKCMEKREPDFIEQDERLKDSQQNEVEISKKNIFVRDDCPCGQEEKYIACRKCPHCSQIIDSQYPHCPGCGSKIKWIA